MRTPARSCPPSPGGGFGETTPKLGSHPGRAEAGRSPAEDSIRGTFARPLAGGPEQKLLESWPPSGHPSPFLAVVENGFYYWAPRGSDGRWPLTFFDLSTRKSAEVARITAASVEQGLTVSPDRKTLLFAVIPTVESNPMLIEHFK